MKKNTKIKLISFLGTLSPKNKVKSHENYWKLIGEKGIIINDNEINDQRVLVLFDKTLDDFKIENHNPMKNTLWIKKTDLEIDL